ncbi:MAG TPA: hypothetical protein VIV60_25220 [Polyangiaceae bacterium]
MSNPLEPAPSSGIAANSEEPITIASDTKPVGRAWVIVGSIVVLVGIVMGFVMSSLGK